jgi:putative SOS response-associated peptidase YedK
MFPADPRGLHLDTGPDTGSAHGPGWLGSVLRWNPKTGKRSVDQLAWGLLPHDTKDPANAPRPIMARAETVATHPLVASAFRSRRAIVPMSVYYQRLRTAASGERFAISRKDGEPMAVAGLWESFRWPDGRILRTYCVITTAANPLVAPINDRMLVILDKADWPVWLGERQGDPVPFLHPPPPDGLQCRPVGGHRAKRQHDLF